MSEPSQSLPLLDNAQAAWRAQFAGYFVFAALIVVAGALLTAAGAALLPEAKALLARADHAAALARATGSGERGRLRISLTRSLTGGIAGAIVDGYRARYPDVELDLRLGTTMLHARQLLDGEIDVGFVRPPLEVDGLEELVLGREPMVCVLPKGHPLTKRNRG